MNATKHTALWAVAACALLVALSPLDAYAQQRLTVKGRGGIAVPAGDLADLQDVGATFGVGLAYRVHPRVAVRVDGDLEILNGADLESGTEAPDLTLWHYNAGAELSVLEPGATRWTVLVNGAAGATTIDSDDFGGVSGGSDFNQTYFSLNGGLELGYDVTRQLNLYAGGQIYVIFADEDDTAAFAALSPEVDAFSTAVSFPISGGVKYSF